ncbi:MAG: homogentisate 1,2-dioxygenase domain-containing protein, partial [Pseudomonadota bacterium]
CMVPHGPDAAAFAHGTTQSMAPEQLKDTMAFMFETRYLIRPTAQAMAATELQSDYADAWAGLERHFET